MSTKRKDEKMGEILKQNYEERDLIKALAKLNGFIDKDAEKLSDKYHELKKSHKKLEKLVMDFRNLLIAMQNELSFALCPKCIEEKLRHVNLALGYNQWENVKEIKPDIRIKVG